jgi:AcrR family transcriptional regulator
MPRVAGQIDLIKSEAVLDAAGRVFAARGLNASLETVARDAGVSKQTIYNHYGGKAGLVRALIRRRVDQMTAPLADPELDVETALTAFAAGLMQAILTPANLALTRVAIQSVADMPDVARAVYEAGSQTTRARLADYLLAETRAGRLAVADPAEAAEFFGGMAAARQLRGLLGMPIEADPAVIERLSRNIARRFLRAYAPQGV